MIYTPLTKKALKLCFEAHKDQVDKAGLPYVFHPFHLAEQMEDEDSTVTALLHDVVEDSPCTLRDLKKQGFPPQVLEALSLLTRDPAEPYLEYVCRVGCNPIAAQVKLADLDHNSDLSRLDQVTEQDRQRAEKYTLARTILSNFRYDPELGYGSTSFVVNQAGSIYLTITATPDQILGFRVDAEEEGVRLALPPAAVRQLEALWPGEDSFFRKLERYLEQHDFARFRDFLDQNGVFYTEEEQY